MIVAVQRINTHYCRICPHHEGLEAWWLSPGGLEFIRGTYDYEPYSLEIVPLVVVETLRMRRHLCKIRDAPPTGTFLEPFCMEQRSGVCVLM